MILKTDKIITAFGQDAAGLRVIVRDKDHHIREECIQPKDQTPEMHLLYDISQSVNQAMVLVVINWRERETKRGKKP